ncbi:helix-turn-helix domain-containing protein [Latilactobacillus fragifolii]|uniref:helix-turn-helix domain-containing protein n=1 Tax=Latilactobacillus fragifolii TaxID=2814244 RepID=UPI001ABABF84|nr:helix-turn-helix domain-containing protein [Latilactobacillus fragifolii]
MDKTNIDEFLKKRGLTRYQVAQLSGISQSTLNDARKRPINAMTVKTLQALAMATAETPGAVLDELLKLQGNPIIGFIQAHPFLKKELVTEIEDLLIKAHEANINLKTVTFNRYYTENEDTNENATKALINLKEQLEIFINNLSEEKE